MYTFHIIISEIFNNNKISESLGDIIHVSLFVFTHTFCYAF